MIVELSLFQGNPEDRFSCDTAHVAHTDPLTHLPFNCSFIKPNAGFSLDKAHNVEREQIGAHCHLPV